MGQDVRATAKLQAERERKIVRLLKGASTTPWWKQFVELIRERRAYFLEDLAAGVMDQRAEDRQRGRIEEDAWIILLQEQADNLIEGEDHATVEAGQQSERRRTTQSADSRSGTS